MATKKMAKATNRKAGKATGKRKASTTYIRIAHHIYSTGVSYRVRAVIDGDKVSVYFTNKRKAIQFRNRLLAR